MDHEMRSDVDLLVDIFNNNPLVTDRAIGRQVVVTRKLVSYWTGVSIQTISTYCTGQHNIPIHFWRVLFSKCPDPRIPALLLGYEENYELILHDDDESCAPREFFKEAVENNGTHHETQKYIAEIIADGRIDELDERSVTDYHDAYIVHRQTEARLHRAIMNTYQRHAVKARAAR